MGLLDYLQLKYVDTKLMHLILMFLISKNRGGIDALIGLDFFRHFLITIDYSNGFLITRPYNENIIRHN